MFTGDEAVAETGADAAATGVELPALMLMLEAPTA